MRATPKSLILVLSLAAAGCASEATSDKLARPAVVQQAVEAQIPVVTVDRRVPSVEGILAHVGADNVKGGEAQGNLVVSMFPDGATIKIESADQPHRMNAPSNTELDANLRTQIEYYGTP